ncbi:hypothetical protein BOTBODRAFT_168835 [Botryobasidium botryosum FD-172 SS1]|uniref:Uncharacterized protein n=1 Tax=Botryobasidium botryosum (strain FD-172 SS1) TaxID=930990 RepID=A0A067N3P2_BOTB1|nr:hypothetical protein BOTBODRAFT_168835 [Botryobasidium botryosum FD-172 SS1]
MPSSSSPPSTPAFSSLPSTSPKSADFPLHMYPPSRSNTASRTSSISYRTPSTYAGDNPSRYSHTSGSPIPLERLGHARQDSRSTYNHNSINGTPRDYYFEDGSSEIHMVSPEDSRDQRHHGHHRNRSSRGLQGGASNWENAPPDLFTSDSEVDTRSADVDPHAMSHSTLLFTHIELRGQFKSLQAAHLLLVNTLSTKVEAMGTSSQAPERDVDGLTIAEQLSLKLPSSHDDYPMTNFWHSGSLKAWIAARKKDRDNKATAFGDSSKEQRLRGKATVSQGINVAYPFYENEEGKIYDGHQVSALNSCAKRTFYDLLRRGLGPSAWGNKDGATTRIFRSAMYKEFPDLRLCKDHWKADFIGTKLYTGARDMYYENLARVKIKEEAVDLTIASTTSKRARSNTTSSPTTTIKKARVLDTESAGPSSPDVGESPSVSNVQLQESHANNEETTSTPVPKKPLLLVLVNPLRNRASNSFELESDTLDLDTTVAPTESDTSIEAIAAAAAAAVTLPIVPALGTPPTVVTPTPISAIIPTLPMPAPASQSNIAYASTATPAPTVATPAPTVAAPTPTTAPPKGPPQAKRTSTLKKPSPTSLKPV